MEKLNNIFFTLMARGPEGNIVSRDYFTNQLIYPMQMSPFIYLFLVNRDV